MKSTKKRYITIKSAESKFSSIVKRLKGKDISGKQIILLRKDITGFINKCNEYLTAISTNKIKPRGNIENIIKEIQKMKTYLSIQIDTLPEVVKMKNDPKNMQPIKKQSKRLGKLTLRGYFQENQEDKSYENDLRMPEVEVPKSKSIVRNYPLSEFISDTNTA